MPQDRSLLEMMMSEQSYRFFNKWVERPLLFIGGLFFLSIGLLGCWASFVAPADPTIAYDPSTTPLYQKLLGCFIALVLVGPYVDMCWGAMGIPWLPTLIHRPEKEPEMVSV